MKRLRLLSIVLIFFMLTTMLVGCRRDDGDGHGSSVPEFVYLPESIPIPIPEDHWIGNIVIANDAVIFSTGQPGTGEQPLFFEGLMSMNIDGSDLTELPNYRVRIPPRVTGGRVEIAAMHIDNEGFLWIIESGRFMSFDQVNLVMNTIVISTLLKLDETGAVLFSLDVSDIIGGNFAESVKLCTDKDGNIYVSVWGDISILDPSGVLLFTLELQGWYTDVVKLADGTVVGFGWRGQVPLLMHIDTANKSWGETITIPPMNIKAVFPGNDDFTVIFNDGLSLFGLCAETNEISHLINWIDSGLNAYGISNVAFQSEEPHLLATSEMYSVAAGRRVTELIVLTRTLYSELPEREVLTLATFMFEGDLRNAVLHFNKTSTTHRIQVVDYSIFNTHENHLAGLTRLYAELISGRIPDLLDMSHLSLEVYAARGLLEDLNPFLDADPAINRNDIVDNVLRASEIDGALYRMFPTFGISTIIGNPNVVGSDPGWSFSEFKAVIEANPQVDFPLGPHVTRESIFKQLFQHNTDLFVDWKTGVIDFESNYFIELLTFSGTFPAEPYMVFFDSYEQEVEFMAAGRRIMFSHDLWNFHDFIYYRNMLGGDVIVKGFPAENRYGNRFIIPGGVAMTVGCEDKQGAWDFIRTFLKEGFQREFIFDWDFSVNRARLDDGVGYAMGNYADLTQLPPEHLQNFLYQEEADMLISLIDSISGVIEHDEILWNIISESTADYFRGLITAQEAARIIQSRASRYMSELS